LEVQQLPYQSFFAACSASSFPLGILLTWHA
jgi:hypothetical protein